MLVNIVNSFAGKKVYLLISSMFFITFGEKKNKNFKVLPQEKEYKWAISYQIKEEICFIKSVYSDNIAHSCTNCENLEMEPKYLTKSDIQLNQISREQKMIKGYGKKH